MNEILTRIKNRWNNKITISCDNIPDNEKADSNYKIEFKCSSCNKIDSISIRSLLKPDLQEPCRYCRHNMKHKRNFQHLINMAKMVNLKILSSDYKDFTSKIKVQCEICNDIFMTTWREIKDNLYKKCTCGKNAKDEFFKDSYNKKVINDFNIKYRDNFILNEYSDKFGKITHIKCGRSFNVKLVNFYRSNNCPLCHEEELQNERFLKLQNRMKIETPDFELLEFDGHWSHNAKVKHICSHIFEIRPENLILRNRCPKCDRNKSIGVKKIEKFLKSHNIKFDVEYSFTDLKDKGKLRFDFVIFNSDKTIYTLLEFDGIQHFSTDKGSFRKSFKESENYLKYIQEHDELKDNYCRLNNIRLERIRYDDNIIEKLENIFNDYPNGGEIPQQE